MSTKQQHRAPVNNGRYIKQYINKNRTTTLDRTAALVMVVGGGLKAIYLRQIFALDSVVVEKKRFGLLGGFLNNIIYVISVLLLLCFHARLLVVPCGHLLGKD